MITGSVMIGRLVTGEIVLIPPPGMLKEIMSVPGVALAQLIASRKLPAPVSAVVVTLVQPEGGGAGVAKTHCENSEVPSMASVAVEVTNWPGVTATGNTALIAALLPTVVTEVDPRK